MLRIGLISDTHDLLRPAAKEFLRGCDHIIHGGDITKRNIVDELATLAPVTAVRGNNDREAWAEHLRETALVRFGEIGVYVIHDLAALDIKPLDKSVHVVISGHSHKPNVEERNGVLFVNPGSAGPRRFKLPISVAELIISDNAVSARILELE